MRFTKFSTIADVLGSKTGKQVLSMQLPLVAERMKYFANYDQMKNEPLYSAHFLGIDENNVDEIVYKLNNAQYQPPDNCRSLDEIDRESFRSGLRPFDSAVQRITLSETAAGISSHDVRVTLDGEWKMKEELPEDEAFREENWINCYKAEVPGSIHTALEACGKIPDSTIGTNQRYAKAESYKTWWLKKQFAYSGQLGRNVRLVFDGVCDRASFYLNGVCLGKHQGMFGGPEFDITPYLKEQNTLLVKLEPVPFVKRDPNSEHIDIDNISWRDTVVFINGYGWHYSHLQPLGIWRSVSMESINDTELDSPFIFTKCAETKTMGLVLDFFHGAGERGELSFKISPENFEGKTLCFNKEIVLTGGYETQIRDKKIKMHSKWNYEFEIPDARLWWPVDLGEPYLYRLEMEYKSEKGVSIAHTCTFGVRTVEMAPLADGKQEDKYDWTFVINGEKHFIKGTGWCTLDPRMKFPKEKYDRLLSLAKGQHIQMLRGWGGGMPETCEFYDLCDRYGIMVLQEWPSASNSHLTQPYDVMKETVIKNTIRLRNRASLVLWGAGNESYWPFGDVIDMMGRLSIELDGTRAFHRGEPWGGSQHDYNVWWGRQHFDYNLRMTADFLAEFGVCCIPSRESIAKYLPGADFDAAPPFDNDQFIYHTPVFGRRDDISRMQQYAGYFTHEDCSFKEFIAGSQMSQTVAVKHALERARTRWPMTTGSLYYKLNDNFPSASWSVVDWYGAPKIGYYSMQDAYEPLSAIVLFDTVNSYGTPCELPVFLLDDTDALKGRGWKVKVMAFDGKLREIKRVEFDGSGGVCPPHRLGVLPLSYEETKTSPLFVVSEVWAEEKLIKRNYYFINFEYPKGCLFELPKTSLTLAVNAGKQTVSVSNTGALPAVMVNVECPGRLDEFTVSDNYFWLNAGETAVLEVSSREGLRVSALNSGE